MSKKSSKRDKNNNYQSKVNEQLALAHANPLEILNDSMEYLSEFEQNIIDFIPKSVVNGLGDTVNDENVNERDNISTQDSNSDNDPNFKINRIMSSLSESKIYFADEFNSICIYAGIQNSNPSEIYIEDNITIDVADIIIDGIITSFKPSLFVDKYSFENIYVEKLKNCSDNCKYYSIKYNNIEYIMGYLVDDSVIDNMTSVFENAIESKTFFKTSNMIANFIKWIPNKFKVDDGFINIIDNKNFIKNLISDDNVSDNSILVDSIVDISYIENKLSELETFSQSDITIYNIDNDSSTHEDDENVPDTDNDRDDGLYVDEIDDDDDDNIFGESNDEDIIVKKYKKDE